MSNLTNWVTRCATAAGRADIAAMRRIVQYLAERETQISIIRNKAGMLNFGGFRLVVDFKPQGSGQYNYFFLIVVTDASGRRIAAVELRPRRGYDSLDKLADLKVIW